MFIFCKFGHELCCHAFICVPIPRLLWVLTVNISFLRLEILFSSCNTQIWKSWHFCTTSNGSKLGMDTCHILSVNGSLLPLKMSTFSLLAGLESAYLLIWGTRRILGTGWWATCVHFRQWVGSMLQMAMVEILNLNIGEF